MQLSEHFDLREFTRSDAAHKIGNANEPPAEHLENLRALARRMEEVRALFGRPIMITSGYRNPAVNEAVGGVPNSDHALGWAADFQVPGLADLEVAKTVRDSGLNFDQLIFEAGRTVHLSFHPRLRRQVLRQPGGPGSPVYDGLEAEA